jgi:hypothetical protein
MTTQIILGGDLNKPQYIGEHGNLSYYDGFLHLYKNATDLSIQMELLTIPTGTQIHRITSIWNGAYFTNGGHTDVCIGWRYKSGRAGGGDEAFIPWSDATPLRVGANYIPRIKTAFGSSGNNSGVFDEDVIVYVKMQGASSPVNTYLLNGFQIYLLAEGQYINTR